VAPPLLLVDPSRKIADDGIECGIHPVHVFVGNRNAEFLGDVQKEFKKINFVIDQAIFGFHQNPSATKLFDTQLPEPDGDLLGDGRVAIMQAEEVLIIQFPNVSTFSKYSLECPPYPSKELHGITGFLSGKSSGFREDWKDNSVLPKWGKWTICDAMRELLIAFFLDENVIIPVRISGRWTLLCIDVISADRIRFSFTPSHDVLSFLIKGQVYSRPGYRCIIRVNA
jgi:hypothetical protein